MMHCVSIGPHPALHGYPRADKAAPGTSPRGALDIEYKYVVVNQDGNVGCWKPGGNYRVTLPLQASGAKVPKRVKVADAWDDSFKKVDVEEAETTGASGSSAGGGGAVKSSVVSEQLQQPEPRQQVGQQPAAAPQIGGTTAAAAAAPAAQPVKPAQTAMPVTEGNSSNNGAPQTSQPSVAGGPQQATDRIPRQPRATSPRSPPPSFAAATTIPVIHPSLLAEQERLEDGVG
jgi:hypothetical protein